MNRLYVLAILFLTVHCWAVDPEPYLKSAPMPFYPPLCREARISGNVTIHFTVDEHGDVLDVEATNGPKLLREAAAESVQSWKFAWAKPCACRVTRKVVFTYSIGNWMDDDGPSSIVKWFGKSPVQRVEIQAGGISAQP